MRNNKLTKALQKLGISETAIQIYGLLLDQPQISITELCTQTGQYRAKIYEALEELKVIDLVERENDFKRQIRVSSPTTVFTLLKQKQYEINRSVVDFQEELPYILANYFDQKTALDVKVFDGENKFTYLLTTILDECIDGIEMVSFNENNDIYNIIDAKYFFDVWVEKRIAKKIFNRILLHPKNIFINSQQPLDQTKFRETKILPNSNSDQGCYWIIDSKIIFWDTVTPKAILIENKVLACVMKFGFELIWKSVNS
jgi:DNA-binding transcriptional regulator GbsR (MarR family)